MRWIGPTVSVVWGALLGFLLLGAALDGSTGLIVYAGCAVAVWACTFFIARRRGPASTRLALFAIPLSLLGPLAIVPVAILFSRRRRPLTPARPAKPKPKPKPTPTPPAKQPPPAPLPPPPAELASAPPPVAIQTTRRRRSKHPWQVLAAMVIGSVLAFPVVGLAIITLLVLGGVHFLSARDIRNIALISGVVAGFALLGSALVWQEQSRESSTKARRFGWSLILTAAALVGAATFVFTSGTSPKNLSRPSVSGRPQVGSLLTAHVGRWTAPGGPLKFDYQWQDCNPACVDIYGATDGTYAPDRSDLHKRIRVAIIATPSRGTLDFSSDWSYSSETARVVGGS
jgi:hypothetical protein